MPRSWLALPLLSILATAALAQEVPGGPGGPLGQAGVRASERLPAQGVVVVQRDTGELVAMTNNGRYVIRGEIWDAWGKRKLASMDEVHASAASMPIEQLMAGRWGDLAPVTYGTGPRTVTLFVDPLCPTCKQFHERLVSEGAFEKLDVTIAIFPLDSECNWMLDRPVHPGSCAVTRAILCSDHRAMQVLEWSYDHQEEILEAAKAGAGVVNVKAMIHARWPGLDACMDSKDTTLRLNKMLRYIVNNHLQVSTPQLFLGDTRLCDEDTDMGLAYTMKRLAPALRTK